MVCHRDQLRSVLLRRTPPKSVCLSKAGRNENERLHFGTEPIQGLLAGLTLEAMLGVFAAFETNLGRERQLSKPDPAGDALLHWKLDPELG
jgi:hypothetical protein